MLPPWPPAGLEVFRLPTLLPHAVPGHCHTCNLRRHARSEGAAGLELPEPVLTSDMMPHFEDVAIIPNPGERAEAMRQLINRLPTANRLLLQYMFKHMGHIIARVVPIRRPDSPTGHLYSKSKSKTASPPRPLSPPQSSLHGLLQGLRCSGSPHCCPTQCQGSATPVICGAMPGLRAPLDSSCQPSQPLVTLSPLDSG
ncbi:uncharacterized protein LOC126994796 isoform X3 [Eriocheir sinensis]|uniref:uncharacterized protein LOC126994796 isoform X2 n=1 Tax=Eriocheir sinensis TaxID=95602 RepID=UPI0021C9CB01|nr:uncharacterized protein LOC126994796 isoform X2 [Eriocheir sinensis]XP_050710025.1 uncharacterized protein LOC126994796 isoform X3 [Eriocheir sinensis]